MRRLSIYIALVLIPAIAIIFSACGRSRLSVTAAGSTAFQPFAEKLAEEFMAERNDVLVTVQGGGSAVGIQTALSGAADIGMADLVTLPAEAKRLSTCVVARDGIAVVVNPANTASNITLDQLRDIFNGKIANWQEVGGPDKAITVVSREEGSGTRSSFETIVGNVNLSPNAIIQDSNGTIRETVANDANAVGYLSHGLISEKIKAVCIDGKPCTTEEIMCGAYKLVRPIFFLTDGKPESACGDFIDFVLSAKGQKIVQDNGLIPGI